MKKIFALLLVSTLCISSAVATDIRISARAHQPTLKEVLRLTESQKEVIKSRFEDAEKRMNLQVAEARKRLDVHNRKRDEQQKLLEDRNYAAKSALLVVPLLVYVAGIVYYSIYRNLYCNPTVAS